MRSVVRSKLSKTACSHQFAASFFSKLPLLDYYFMSFLEVGKSAVQKVSKMENLETSSEGIF